MPKASIVICTYNNRDIVEKCVLSVMNQTCKDFACYIIDDNSTDGTAEYIRKKYRKINVYKKEKNSGPAASRNIGISITKSQYIAFLDSDVELDKNWLEESIDTIESYRGIGIIGSKLFYSDKKTINSVGGHLSRIGIGFDIGKGKKDTFFERKKLLYVCSAAILVKRSMIKKIGNFDEKFFYGYEDTDICWRANLVGYDVIYNPNSIAYHNVNATVSSMNTEVIFHSTKNKIRMLIKNYSLANLCINLSLQFLVLIIDAMLRKPRKARFKGIIWNIINLKDTLLERKKIQQMRKKKDKELSPLF